MRSDSCGEIDRRAEIDPGISGEKKLEVSGEGKITGKTRNKKSDHFQR
jgi:hypothetical protein